MEKRDYSVLILGNIESIYIVQFVMYLKKVNPHAHLYFWGYTRNEKNIDKNLLPFFDDYCLFDIKSIVNSSFLWKIKAIKQMRKSFKDFVADRHFDNVNIHYVKPEYCFLIDYIKQHASQFVITPWGSDVYGAKGLNRYLVGRIFGSADCITGGNDRFTRDFKRIFHVPDGKIAFCDLGVELIDYIIKHKSLIDVQEAKCQLGVSDRYIITCGYCANPVQRHSEMVDAILSVKDQLPPNLLLLFPFTYPKVPEYIQTIKQKVKDSGLDAVYFEQFLEMDKLFLLRQATDIFIHVQPTDASSASLWEYILCEKKIINGSWLNYTELEKNGKIPYFELDKMDNLGKKIVEVCQSAPIEISSDLFKDFEKKQWKVVIKDWDKLFSTHLHNL